MQPTTQLYSIPHETTLTRRAHRRATVAEVPAPQLLPGCVLVRIAASLVSAGTERASAEFARKNLLAKAKARPDLVRDVVAKMQRDGLASTSANRAFSSRRSRNRWATAAPESVIAVGDGVSDISVGDRVACAGAGYAVHAEFACVPRMLVAKIPEGGERRIAVSYEEAAFGNRGSDLPARHPHRRSRARRNGCGDRTGIARPDHGAVAEGCRLPRLRDGSVGQRADLAIESGAEATMHERARFPRSMFSENWRRRRGLCVDHGGNSKQRACEPRGRAGARSRHRGCRRDCRHGTASANSITKRNWIFAFRAPTVPAVTTPRMNRKGAIIRLAMCGGRRPATWTRSCNSSRTANLNLPSLITHRFPMERATRAYDLIMGDTRRVFSRNADYLSRTRKLQLANPEPFQICRRKSHRGQFRCAVLKPSPGSIGLGVLGAGSFAQNTLLPALKAIFWCFFHRRLQRHRPAQPERGGKIWILLLFKFGSRTSADPKSTQC